MIFTSPIYFVFLMLVLTLYWRTRVFYHRKVILIFASLFFYGWWDYRLLPLLHLTCLANYFIGRAIFQKPQHKKTFLLFGVFFNLAILGFFKYFNFFLHSLQVFNPALANTSLNILLPLGVSFFTFQGISWLMDIYRGKISEICTLIDFLAYKTFFPQLIAGPVVRATDFLPQLQRSPLLENVNFRNALFLFLLGYFKKAVVADSIAILIDPVFQNPRHWSAEVCWIATFAYPVQIYCDFSGYTDMARASANLFGFQFCRNFDAPYLATSVRQYWRRWHISLSTWFRDYLYIPLGGDRGGLARSSFNLFLTMTVCGLWHGAAWSYVIWGALHGFACVVENVWKKTTSNAIKMPAFLGWALSYFFIATAFILFRTQSVSLAGEFYRRLFKFHLGTPYDRTVFHWLALLSFWVVHLGWHRYKDFWATRLRLWPAMSLAFWFGVAVALACFLTPLRVTPFIYFQF